MGYPESERRQQLYTRVLRRLERGPARTEELAAIAVRFGAIIHELRRAGLPITTRRAAGASRIYELNLDRPLTVEVVPERRGRR